MVFKRNTLILLSSIQLLGAFAVIWEYILPIYIFSILLVLVLMVLEYRSMPRGVSLDPVIHFNPRCELAQEYELSVTIDTVFSDIQGMSELKCEPPSSSHLKLIKVYPFVREEFGDGSIRYTFKYTYRACKVGTSNLEGTNLQIISKFRLLGLNLRKKSNLIEIVVSPEKTKVPQALFQRITRNQRVINEGAQTIKKSRAAEQFHSLRPYRFPDPVRHLDHKKSAKYGQLMTRTFESLHAYHLVICLDVGRPMFGTIGQSRKLDYYVSACMNLAEYAMRQGDRVSFLAFSQKAHVKVIKARKPSQIWQALCDKSISEPYEEESNYLNIAHAIPLHAMSRSVVVVLTDVSHPYVQQSLTQAIKGISKKHLALTLSLLDKQFEINSKITSYKGEAMSEEMAAEYLYAYWLSDQISAFSQKMDRFGAGTVVVPDEYWLSVTEKVYAAVRKSGRI